MNAKRKTGLRVENDLHLVEGPLLHGKDIFRGDYINFLRDWLLDASMCDKRKYARVFSDTLRPGKLNRGKELPYRPNNFKSETPKSTPRSEASGASGRPQSAPRMRAGSMGSSGPLRSILKTPGSSRPKSAHAKTRGTEGVAPLDLVKALQNQETASTTNAFAGKPATKAMKRYYATVLDDAKEEHRLLEEKQQQYPETTMLSSYPNWHASGALVATGHMKPLRKLPIKLENQGQQLWAETIRQSSKIHGNWYKPKPASAQDRLRAIEIYFGGMVRREAFPLLHEWLEMATDKQKEVFDELMFHTLPGYLSRKRPPGTETTQKAHMDREYPKNTRSKGPDTSSATPNADKMRKETLARKDEERRSSAWKKKASRSDLEDEFRVRPRSAANRPPSRNGSVRSGASTARPASVGRVAQGGFGGITGTKMNMNERSKENTRPARESSAARRNRSRSKSRNRSKKGIPQEKVNEFLQYKGPGDKADFKSNIQFAWAAPQTLVSTYRDDHKLLTSAQREIFDQGRADSMRMRKAGPNSEGDGTRTPLVSTLLQNLEDRDYADTLRHRRDGLHGFSSTQHVTARWAAHTQYSTRDRGDPPRTTHAEKFKRPERTVDNGERIREAKKATQKSTIQIGMRLPMDYTTATGRAHPPKYGGKQEAMAPMAGASASVGVITPAQYSESDAGDN